jgi:ribosomal protein L5
MARLEAVYKEKIRPALIEQFGYKSVMQAPRITKITLNMGVSGAVADIAMQSLTFNCSSTVAVTTTGSF